MNIKLLGIDDNSSEYRAGIDLKNFFKENFSQLKGEIFIKPNLTLIGNKVEQLDLVVWGTFENSFETPYRLVINPKDPSNNYKPTFESMNSKVKFKNFFLVIEVKDHPFNRIKTVGYDLFVKYSSKNRYEFDWHNASEQSKNQVHTIRGGVSPFLKKNNIEEKYCPQVTNLIWLRQVSLKDIIPFNIINLLPAEFNSQLFFQTIAKCNPPVGLKYPTIDFIKGGIEASLMAKITNSFFESFEKEIYIKSGELTRRKIEEVIQKQIDIEERPYYNDIGKKLIIINGDPGSGKTIHLLQIAYSLYKAQHKRSLILTYNVALASDLNRLSFLSGVQTDQYNPTINIKTIQSFFRDILIAYDLHTPRILENGKLDSDYEINYFLKNYSKLLASLDEIIEADWIDEAEKLKIKRDVIKFNWDIILIDESQDWLEEERNILYKLFGPENFVIAFGDRQFVRQNRGLRWNEYDKNSNELITVDLFKPIINLSKTYRQKQNLVQFQNQLFSDYSWKLKYNKELIGGEVSIYTNMFAKTDLDAIATEWQNENAAPFDLLMLMPKEYYEYTNKLIDFKDWGYECINGIDKLNSRLNSADVNKIRCFQYESCRGLEGWIVVCHWFDVFLQIKYNGYERDPNDQSLVTDEEAKMKHVSDWAFLATSRAMSHLIITIKDKQSKFGKIIIDSFQKNRDFTILD